MGSSRYQVLRARRQLEQWFQAGCADAGACGRESIGVAPHRDQRGIVTNQRPVGRPDKQRSTTVQEPPPTLSELHDEYAESVNLAVAEGRDDLVEALSTEFATTAA